jgi:hypothetical protein
MGNAENLCLVNIKKVALFFSYFSTPFKATIKIVLYGKMQKAYREESTICFPLLKSWQKARFIEYERKQTDGCDGTDGRKNEG